MELMEIILKLFLAVALGGLIGLERESSHKPAGFRTNILICLGATMMMILAGLLIGEHDIPSSEAARIAAGVITGIGFIGAGTIIQSRGTVIGLTTAATLWVVAGLGLLIGAGYYMAGLIFSIIIMLTLVLFRRIEEFYLRKSLFIYNLKLDPSKDALLKIKKFALHEGIKFREISLKKGKDYHFLRLSFSTTDEKEQNFNQLLLQIEGILEINIE